MKKNAISFISIGLMICVFGGTAFAIEIEDVVVFREKRVFEPGAFTGVIDREMMVASAIVDLGTLDPNDYEVYLTSSSGIVMWYLPKYKQFSEFSDTSWEYSYAFGPPGPEWEDVTYTFELVYASDKSPVGVPTKTSNIYSGDVTDPVPIPDWVNISGDCSELQLEWENVLENDCEEEQYTGHYRIRVYPLNPDRSFDYSTWLFRSEKFPCPEYTLTDLCEGCKSFAIGVVSRINYSGAPPLGDGLVNRSQYYFRYDACSSEVSEIIGNWSNGIWYRDVAKSKWTRMYSGVPSGDIQAGDFNGDGKADVASIWSSGLWYQNGATLGWTKVWSTAPDRVTAGDITGDGQDELIGCGGDWGNNGIYYKDFAKGTWHHPWSATPTGPIAAGDVSGDGKAEMVSCWNSGLWYQDGATLSWTKVYGTAPSKIACGDVTGDGQVEIIGPWANGIWYRDIAASGWTRMYSGVPSGEIAAGDFTGDGKADVASCWESGLWYQNGATLDWTKVYGIAPSQLTAGDVTSDSECPESYTSQSSYKGDCHERPSDSVCIQYNDGYIWLVYDSVVGWDTIENVQIAYGYVGAYYHILGTNCVQLIELDTAADLVQMPLKPAPTTTVMERQRLQR